MLRTMTVAFMSSLLLGLPACCADSGKGKQMGPGTGPEPTSHPAEPAFTLHGAQSGSGWVHGTADFNGAGAVVIKVQVEDLPNVAGNQAVVKVWSGNGQVPQTNTVPPANGTEVYNSGGDVPLRFWTEHLDRTYNAAANSYWLFVSVDHNIGNGNRDARILRNVWIPSETSVPDVVHDFDEL